jgi:hypothetical protein
MKTTSYSGRRVPPKFSAQEIREIFEKKTLRELITLSNHCVNNYRLRFKPDLRRGEAQKELYQRMAEQGIFTTGFPDWLVTSTTNNVGYVTIDDEIALPIMESDRASRYHPYVAVTCLYRVHL